MSEISCTSCNRERALFSKALYFSTTNYNSLKSATLGDEVLPGRELVIEDIMTLVELCAIVVAWLLEEQVIFQQLLSYEGRQEALVLLS